MHGYTFVPHRYPIWGIWGTYMISTPFWGTYFNANAVLLSFTHKWCPLMSTHFIILPTTLVLSSLVLQFSARSVKTSLNWIDMNSNGLGKLCEIWDNATAWWNDTLLLLYYSGLNWIDMLSNWLGEHQAFTPVWFWTWFKSNIHHVVLP